MFFAVSPPLPRHRPRSVRHASPLRSDSAERLILLGTAGASNPKATRAGYSNAVVVGDVAYIVDCGEGVHRQAWRSGISMHPERRPKGGSTVRSIFFTHLHSDHVIDFANLLFGFWPTTRVDVFGPGEAGLPITPYPPDRVVPVLFPQSPTPGIGTLTEKLFEAFAYNINVRIADEGRADLTKNVFVHEIGVSPRRLRSRHRSGGRRPVALRCRRRRRRWSPSRSTRSTTTVCASQRSWCSTLRCFLPLPIASTRRLAPPCSAATPARATTSFVWRQGADYLVHEVIDVGFIADRVAKLPNRDSIVNHLTESHTSPEDAGRIAARAGVKTLVLSHLVPGDSEIPEDVWEARARSEFDGAVVCGVDLDQFGLCPS